jgi:hypothetical protein
MVWKSNNLIMTCTNCRNPLSENSTICEWCGNDNSKPNKQTPIVDNKKAKRKALKLTIYIVLIILSFFVLGATRFNLFEFQLFYIIAPPILIYELYLYLFKKFEN